MTSQAQHNFHVPLPPKLYQRLRRHAARSKQPATTLARDAIDWWLHAQEKAALHQAIAEYAAKYAGTALDLDKELEAASLAHLGSIGHES